MNDLTTFWAPLALFSGAAIAVAFILTAFLHHADAPLNTQCDQLQLRGLEPETRYDPQYGCLVKRGDHWEKSKW